MCPPPAADARTTARRRLPGVVAALVFLSAGCHGAETVSMTVLDTARYFTDPRDAAFAELVQKGDVAGVKAALQAGQDVNAGGLKGFRPLHFVFAARDAGVARVLLAAGADPGARIANGNAPLHYAVQQKSADFTAVLLQYKADPNARGRANQPVLFTALDSPIPDQVLPLLVHAGADVDAVWGNNTAVQSAMIGLTWKAAAALLALGADPALRNPHGEDAGMVFCSLLERLAPTTTNHQAVWAVGAALKARGVSLACDDGLARFR
jgi:ankyrin repeat protein